MSVTGCSGLFGPSVSRAELEEEYAVAVEMTDDNDFAPQTVSIAAGESVVWFSNDDSSHTVTAYEAKIPEDAEYFASGGHNSEEEARYNNRKGVVNSGETYHHTFEVPGEYEYFCIPHERRKMVGTIIVEE